MSLRWLKRINADMLFWICPSIFASNLSAKSRGAITSCEKLFDRPAAVGVGVSVFVQVTLEKQIESRLDAFQSAVQDYPEVMECYLMTGDSDYLIRVAVADIGALEKFILEQLTPIAGIEKIRSSFALKQVRYKPALPLPALRLLDAVTPNVFAVARVHHLAAAALAGQQESHPGADQQRQDNHDDRQDIHGRRL